MKSRTTLPHLDRGVKGKSTREVGEAGLRICYWEVLRYDKLHIVKLLLLFKETVDLQGPIFSDFFLFHVKPSIAILTIVSKKTFVNCFSESLVRLSSKTLDASVFLFKVIISSFRSVKIWSKDSQEIKLKKNWKAVTKNIE